MEVERPAAERDLSIGFPKTDGHVKQVVSSAYPTFKYYKIIKCTARRRQEDAYAGAVVAHQNLVMHCYFLDLTFMRAAG